MCLPNALLHFYKIAFTRWLISQFRRLIKHALYSFKDSLEKGKKGVLNGVDC